MASSTNRKKRPIDLTYCEYNLSTMKDTKGGFIAEEPPVPPSVALDPAPGAVRPAQAGLATLPPGTAKITSYLDRPVHPDPKENPQCSKCGSIDIDFNYERHFNVLVCRKCREANPDEYSLLTKTECREDYLLTESELRDAARLPCWPKANPHKSSYSNMLLYMRSQVEAFAWQKWGSPEALDAEFARREAEKVERKAKRFKKKLTELRKKTRTSTWQDRRDDRHEHKYGPEECDPETSKLFQECEECGMRIEFESM